MIIVTILALITRDITYGDVPISKTYKTDGGTETINADTKEFALTEQERNGKPLSEALRRAIGNI